MVSEDKPRIVGSYYRRLAWVLAVVALLFASTGARESRAAGGASVFTSTAYHYALSYPRAWTKVKVKGANFSVAAPNRNAIFTMTVAPGKGSAAALSGALPLVYPTFGQLASIPTKYATAYGRVTGQFTYAFVTGSNGIRHYVFAGNFGYRKHLYTFVAVVVDTSQPTTGLDYQQARAIVQSVRVLA
jgi:hypothetical protein